MTKDGIEYNFDITPYIVSRNYGELNLKYKFSSEMYMNKFKEKALINNTKLYPYGADLHMVDDLKDYDKIEKRGFQIIKNDKIRILNPELMKVQITFDIV